MRGGGSNRKEVVDGADLQESSFGGELKLLELNEAQMSEPCRLSLAIRTERWAQSGRSCVAESSRRWQDTETATRRTAPDSRRQTSKADMSLVETLVRSHSQKCRFIRCIPSAVIWNGRGFELVWLGLKRRRFPKERMG